MASHSEAPLLAHNASMPRSTKDDSSTFTAEERAAMKEYARERKAARTGRPEGTEDVLAKIAAMPAADRALGEKLHALITAAAPHLVPRLWYGMPAYAKDGHVLCFYQNASKFKARYATLGFSDKAALDDGPMWPSSFAITELTPAAAAQVTALVRRAAR